MNVCLINPPFLKNFSRQQRSPAVIKSGTLYYPYWLAFATGVLEEAGFSVRLIDAIAEGLGFEQCTLRAAAFEPDLAVVESSTPSIASDLAYCRHLKEHCGALTTVLVGTHASALCEEILSSTPEVDFIAVGEYEYTLVELAEKMRNGTDTREVSGIAFRDGDRVVRNPLRPYLADLDRLPFLSRVYRDHLDIRKYYFSLADHPMLMLITGRGCPNRCFFCVYPQTLHGRTYRWRSPQNVVDELAYIREQFPEVRELVFEDDTFTANQPRVKEICAQIRQRKLEFNWFANIRVDTSFQTLKAMREAGLRHCAVGFESGSQPILDTMGKGITLAQSLQFKKACDALGILVHGCFMVGFPNETLETMRQTFEFARRLACDSVQFYPLFLYPGTEAYRWASEEGLLRAVDFSQWLTPDGRHNCVFDPAGLSAEGMMHFCEEAYRRFYLSPGYLARKLTQSILDPREARRNFKAGMRFFSYLLFGGEGV